MDFGKNVSKFVLHSMVWYGSNYIVAHTVHLNSVVAGGIYPPSDWLFGWLKCSQLSKFEIWTYVVHIVCTAYTVRTKSDAEQNSLEIREFNQPDRTRLTSRSRLDPVSGGSVQSCSKRYQLYPILDGKQAAFTCRHSFTHFVSSTPWSQL